MCAFTLRCSLYLARYHFSENSKFLIIQAPSGIKKSNWSMCVFPEFSRASDSRKRKIYCSYVQFFCRRFSMCSGQRQQQFFFQTRCRPSLCTQTGIAWLYRSGLLAGRAVVLGRSDCVVLTIWRHPCCAPRVLKFRL